MAWPWIWFASAQFMRAFTGTGDNLGVDSVIFSKIHTRATALEGTRISTVNFAVDFFRGFFPSVDFGPWIFSSSGFSPVAFLVLLL